MLSYALNARKRTQENRGSANAEYRHQIHGSSETAESRSCGVFTANGSPLNEEPVEKYIM